MLQNTFVHSEGIGYSTEQALWQAGARNWTRYLEQHSGGMWRGARFDGLATTLEKSHRALHKRDVTFFSQKLASKDQWRLFADFGDRVAYLDIETTGLSPSYHDVTVVAVHDGSQCRTFVRGKNLNDFPATLSRYSLLVTFNGSQFDVPFLRATFRGLRVPPAHIDLRFALAQAGYRGGLKSIERQVGIKRPSHLREVDGLEAIRLWRRYQSGSRGALDTLLEYASEDVKSLPVLATFACRALAKASGMPRLSS
jgi:uncharacterized protein YprB with RNaseH-like and TPR domain